MQYSTWNTLAKSTSSQSQLRGLKQVDKTTVPPKLILEHKASQLPPLAFRASSIVQLLTSQM
jgi:hypothetical protein